MKAMRSTELKIAQEVIKNILDKGYTISVWDPDDKVQDKTRNIELLMDAMFSTHDTILWVYHKELPNGFVHFGSNMGVDTIIRYSEHLKDCVLVKQHQSAQLV